MHLILDIFLVPLEGLPPRPALDGVIVLDHAIVPLWRHIAAIIEGLHGTHSLWCISDESITSYVNLAHYCGLHH